MTTPIYINAKITTKEFIKKSKRIHGGLFNYSELVYLGSIAKVEIICKFHGDCFHGNPNRFNDDDNCHPIGEIYPPVSYIKRL